MTLQDQLRLQRQSNLALLYMRVLEAVVTGQTRRAPSH